MSYIPYLSYAHVTLARLTSICCFFFYTPPPPPSSSSFKYMHTVLATSDYLKNASCNRNKNQRIPISESAVRF